MPNDWNITRTIGLSLDRPRVMAILNVTPDSFYDGGALASVEQAVAAAERAAADGADVLDVGGESTRPGASAVSPQEQIGRVVPVVRAIRSAGVSVPISIDTTSAAVAEAALDAGADAINDVSAGRDDPGMFPLAAARGCGLVLMHRLRPPRSDTYSDQYGAAAPVYADVLEEVKQFLSDRTSLAIGAGVARECILVDPGLGFGKTVEQNLELVRRTPEIAALGFPVLSAASRKSFVGRASGQGESTPAQRLAGSIAVSVAHWFAGARVFRVHDVAQQIQALNVAAALRLPE